jgi:ribonuclease T2
MPSISKIAGAALAVFLPFTFAGPHETCADTSDELSCSGSSANTCCINSPGGLFQQVQFWDTSPSTGPSTSWTIHGLWPNNCDGTYSENCDSSRDYTNITELLTNAGQTSVLDYMQTYWVSDDESNEAFWDHEWKTHGTCISTLDPSCYTNYSTGEEAVGFFITVVGLFQTLPTYTVSSIFTRQASCQ